MVADSDLLLLLLLLPLRPHPRLRNPSSQLVAGKLKFATTAKMRTQVADFTIGKLQIDEGQAVVCAGMRCEEGAWEAMKEAKDGRSRQIGRAS